MLDYANKKMNKLTKMKSNGGRRKKEGNEECVMISFSFVQFTMFSPLSTATILIIIIVSTLSI